MKHTNYLLGDASDPANWGDSAFTRGGVWAPLELVVAPVFRANFMFMEIVPALVGAERIEVYLYKHDLTREYVNVDQYGRLYVWDGDERYLEIPLEQARHRLVGGLVSALESGVNISQDMRAAYERLARVTGLVTRKRTD